MHEQSLKDVIETSIDEIRSGKPISNPVVKKKMVLIAKRNKELLSYKNMPEYLRVPTADELVEMRQWAIDFKKANPRTSKRQLRIATQAHFRIKIYK